MPKKVAKKRRVVHRKKPLKGKGIFDFLGKIADSPIGKIGMDIGTKLIMKKLGLGRKKKRGVGTRVPGRGVVNPGRSRRGNGLQRKSLI